MISQCLTHPSKDVRVYGLEFFRGHTFHVVGRLFGGGFARLTRQKRTSDRGEIPSFSGLAETTAVRLELPPIAPTAADHDDEQPERQVDSDDLADVVEGGAGAWPVLDIGCAFERQPWSVEQPDEQRDHQPADPAGTGKAPEGREQHPIAAGEQQQDR
jgi:hypothetical protein